MKFKNKIFLFFLISLAVAVPAELLFNLFEDFFTKFIPLNYRMYFNMIFLGVTFITSWYIFSKSENKAVSSILKKLRVSNIEKPLDNLVKNKLVLFFTKYLGGICYNCNKMSMSPISHKLQQKAIYRCLNCSCINRQSVPKGLFTLISSSLTPFLVSDIYQKHLKELFEISKITGLFIGISIFFIFYFSLTYLFVINSKYEVLE